MEVKYIVGLATLSLFVVLLLIYFAMFYIRRVGEYRRLHNIETSLENPVKMEYDFAVYDEETERIIARGGKPAEQLTIDEVMGNPRDAQSAADIFARIDIEGFEEITGNYKP